MLTCAETENRQRIRPGLSMIGNAVVFVAVRMIVFLHRYPANQRTPRRPATVR